MNCPNCARKNPADARYCIYCATALQTNVQSIPIEEEEPATGATRRLQPEPKPSYTMPQTPAPAPAGPLPVPRTRRYFGNDTLKAVWLIGLGVLLLTGSFFPGILVLIGLTSYIRDNQHGQPQKGLRNLVFFTGLALLFWTNFIFPGIFFLLGAMWLLNNRGYRFGC